MRINLDIPNPDLFNALMLDAAQKRALLNALGNDMLDNTRQRFADERAPNGTPWQKSYRARAQSGQTLKDSARLYNSLTYVIALSGDYLEMGTNVQYAPYLHYGAHIRAKNDGFLRFKTAFGWVSKKEVHLPARPFLGINESDKQTIAATLASFLEGNNAR